MTTPYLQGTGAVPRATALLLRGVQTDPFGEVRGGHRALYDYSTLGASIASGGVVDNLIVGGEDGAMVGVTASNIIANRGIRKTSVASVYFGLGAAFNLLNAVYGSEPSIVISAWMTHDDLTVNILPALGYANGASQNCQWQWGVTTNAGGNFRAVVNGVSVYTTLVAGTAYLHTLYFRRTAAGAYEVQVYIGSTLVGTISGQSYPFKDPTGIAGSPAPAFGWAQGWSTAYLGTLHRAQVFQVDPVTFDVADWLAAEIAANAGRWA